jgi:hypothetical protein
MDIVEIFDSVRDIEYRIPLAAEEEDRCCSGKSEMLLGRLRRNGYEARPRICYFLWSDLQIPEKVLNVPHDNECSHEYVEVHIDGRWVIADATWDIGIGKAFHVNHWDGKSDTIVAVKAIRTLTPEESEVCIRNEASKEAMEADLKKNGMFYKAFNDWLEELRRSA